MADKANGKVLFLAGGTDILVDARKDDRFSDCTVVDIFNMPELKNIENRGERLYIGAGATHTMVAESPLIQQFASVLSQACLSVGSLQIRNHATLAGNIANGSPAADSLAALAVLNAEIEIVNGGNQRLVPITDIITGPYATSLSDKDLITGILIRKLPEGCRCVFRKLGRRKALAISRMTLATILARDAGGIVTDFCITAGAVFPSPMTFPEIDALLIGKASNKGRYSACSQSLIR